MVLLDFPELFLELLLALSIPGPKLLQLFLPSNEFMHDAQFGFAWANKQVCEAMKKQLIMVKVRGKMIPP